HVRRAGTHEGEERAQPALGHVEHDLARLDAGGGELLEYEVGEGAHVLLASAAGELPCAHRIEGHHEPLGVLAPELGTASPAAAAHADAHELEALHATRISPRPTAVKPGARRRRARATEGEPDRSGEPRGRARAPGWRAPPRRRRRP